MKKTALLLAICLSFSVLCLSIFATDEVVSNEWNEWRIEEWNEEWVAGENYTDGIILIFSLELIDTSKYADQEVFDFYGVTATNIEFSEGYGEWFIEAVGYVVYSLDLDPSISVREAFEILKANEEFSTTAHARPDTFYRIPSNPDNSDNSETDIPESAPKSDALPDRTVWNDEWVEGYNYGSDRIIIYTDFILDASQYDFDNFYGMKITRIFYWGSYLLNEQEFFEKYGYVLYVVMFDPAETSAKELFFALNNEYHLVPRPYFLEQYDEVIPDDVNGDGEFNMFDYIYVKSTYFAADATDEEKINADLNGDGKVNMFDYIQIKNNYFAQ